MVEEEVVAHSDNYLPLFSTDYCLEVNSEQFFSMKNSCQIRYFHKMFGVRFRQKLATFLDYILPDRPLDFHILAQANLQGHQ